MDNENYVVNGNGYDLEEFMKPKCPVKVGDRFYKNHHAQNIPNYVEVLKIEDAKDDNGIFYIITGKYINVTVGINVRLFSSRIFNGDEYTILKRGIDF